MSLKELLLFSLCLSTAFAQCPHQLSGLKRWSDSATWPQGVPSEGSVVDIYQHILLDVSTPDLATVNISTNGKLIFDPDSSGVKLTAENVLVEGEFWIGSEDCPFDGDAEVELIGRKSEVEAVNVNDAPHEKAILVVENGVLEIHGRYRTPWCRLTTTLHKTTDESIVGSPIFNHKDTEHHQSWMQGIIAYEFDTNGQMVRFIGRLTKVCDIAKLVTMQDSVIVLATQRRLLMNNGESLEEAIVALEQVCFGGQPISQARQLLGVTENTAWAGVCHVGHPENSIDEVGVASGEWSRTSRLAKAINGHEFVAYSAVKVGGTWPYELDILSYTEGDVPSDSVVLSTQANSHDWQAGEKIVISSTDYDFNQAEEFELQICPECQPGQIKLQRPFMYTHWGETTDGINMGAEVMLLNRNIRIHGRMENECYGDNNCDKYDFDTYGGHIKFFSGFRSGRIENAELYHMGQNSLLGSYPIHFHMCGNITGMSDQPYVKHNSIHNTFARCVTIHGTSGMLLEGNAAYDNMGHCYFLEDGSEFNTEIIGNLGLSTKRTDIIPTDHSTPSTFWITHPSTVMRGNVAGGSHGFGIWYIFPRTPIGPSADLELLAEDQALRTPLAEFSQNVAHSNNEYGLRFDNILRPDGRAVGGFRYNPVEDPLDPNSPRVTTTFDGFRAFKNYKSVMVRGASVVLNNFQIAESVEGIKLQYSSPGAKRVTNSLIVGETENKGKPEGWIRLSNGTRIWWDRQIRMNGRDNALPIIGVIFYEPYTYLDNVEFRRFESNIVRPSGALGIRRRNTGYTSPANSVKNLQFHYVDPDGGNRFYDASEGRGFEDLSGNINTIVRDRDGSLTTYAGSSVVKPYPFLLNARCAEVPQWNMYVCPSMFTKLNILWMDVRGDTFITRNDRSADFTLSGQRHQAYALNPEEGYILHFNETVPRRILFSMTGIEQGVSQLFGICIGRNVVPRNFNVQGATLSSAQDLFNPSVETTRYYHDVARGVIMFRFASNIARDDSTEFECPGPEDVTNTCPTVFIELHDTNTDGDCRQSAYPEYESDPVDSTGALTTPVFT